MDGQYYNLWSTDNDRTDANDDVVIKSVYDPSPVGYSLPASNAFRGFTTTGQNVGNGNIGLFNVKGGFNKGWYFYTKPSKQGIPFFFPAWGYRYDYAGSLTNVTAYGDYWVAGPNNTNFGRFFYLHSGYVTLLDYTYRSYGLVVRSAEEKKLIRIFKIRLLASLLGRHKNCLPRAAQAKPHPLSRLLKIKSELCRRTQPSGHSPLIITWYCFCSRL